MSGVCPAVRCNLKRQDAAQKEPASARSELRQEFGCHKLTSPEGKPLINFAHGNQGHQRESKSGPAGGGGRGTDDGCTAGDCALGCGGLGCGIGAVCWDRDGGVDDIFCLMSSSTACSVAMFWAI
jgi:hypothetical protein